ncbi:MAG: hypothetical protein E7E64_05085 [Clostridium celatum]|uniref:hypothetical protein n=1 Tax=Clostridium tertium TaxID=1559 RepID=UPI0028FE5988|nr:hypothetical protein [Clostridium celatum]
MGDQLSLFDMINNKLEVNKEDNNKIVTTESIDLITRDLDSNKTFILNEEVMVSYLGELYRGVVINIYNNNLTINCIFDGGTKHTAFHISRVFKMNDI